MADNEESVDFTPHQEFCEKTVGELKCFLSERGLKLSGSREEVVSRAFVAWEQGIPQGIMYKL